MKRTATRKERALLYMVAKGKCQKCGVELGRGVDRNDNIISIKQGTSKSYLLRRMARDFPEALDKIETGEFKSTRQAAIHCGIVKVKTPLEQILTIAKKLSSASIKPVN